MSESPLPPNGRMRELSTIVAAVVVILGGGWFTADTQVDSAVQDIAAKMDSALVTQSLELQTSEVTTEHFNSILAIIIAQNDSILQLLGEP